MNTTLGTLSTTASANLPPNLTALPISPLVFRLLAAKRRVSQTETRLAQKELAGPPNSSAELARLRTMHEDVRMAKDDLTAANAALASVATTSGGAQARTWIDVTSVSDMRSVASALASLEAFVWSASGAAAQVQDAAMSLVSKASGKPVPIADPVNTSAGLPAGFMRQVFALTQTQNQQQLHPVGQWHAWVDCQLRMALAQVGPARFSQWGIKLLSSLLGVEPSAVGVGSATRNLDPLSSASTSPPQIGVIPGTVVHLLTKHLTSNPDPSIPPNKQKPLPTISSSTRSFLPSYQSLSDLAGIFRDYALTDVSKALPLDRIPFSEPGILRLVDHATANASDAWIRTLVRMQTPSDPAQWGLWPTEPPTGAGIGVSHGDEDSVAIKDAMWLPVAKAKVAHDLLMCALVPV